MSQVSTCPDSIQLKDLLDGNLPEQQQLELNAHLENCPACQHNLESLASLGRILARARPAMVRKNAVICSAICCRSSTAAALVLRPSICLAPRVSI